MAKIETLPSGNKRIRIYDYTDSKGCKHYKSITARTKKEVQYLAAQYEHEKQYRNIDYDELTVYEIVRQYIDTKARTLSPTTITGYKSDLKNHFEEISTMKIKVLNSAILQRWIGNLSVRLSPKSVSNTHGLLIASLNFFDVGKHFKVKLPEQHVKIGYIPTDDDIQTLIDYYKNHNQNMLIAVCLSAFGTLRRSELSAVTANDVIGNKVIINKAMVWDDELKQWIIKPTPKNNSSNRIIEYPQFVIDLLPETGRLVNMLPSTISTTHYNTMHKLDVPYFRFHDFRHYSASIMHAIGIPDVYIMQRGGWSSDKTLKKVYRNALEDYNRTYTDQTINYFEKYDTKYDTKK